MNDPDLLTTQEVADALRVSRMTIYRQIKAGRLEAVRIGRLVRIPRVELERYVRRRAGA